MSTIIANEPNINTFGTLNAPNTSNSHYFAGGKSGLNLTEAKNRRASQYLTDCIGINIGVAGTLYFTATGSTNDRYMRVYRGNSDDTQTIREANDNDTVGLKLTVMNTTLTKDPEVYSVNLTKARTYWISSSKGAYSVHAMCFIPASGKAEPMTKTVTITSAGMATFSATQNYTLPAGLTAYRVASTNETSAIMEELMDGVVPACTGVILKGEEGTYTLTSTEDATTPVGTNLLEANLADYSLVQTQGTYTNYTLSATGFKKVASTSPGTLAAGKAFLRLTTPASGSGAAKAMYSMDFDTMVTGIENVMDSTGANAGGEKDGTIYNLAGQKVGNGYHGIVIKNGKKYIYK